MVAEIKTPPTPRKPETPAEQQRRRIPTSRVAIWAPFIAVLVLGIALTYGIWRHIQAVEEQKKFAQKTAEVAADYFVAKRDSKPHHLVLPGNIVAVEEATLYARSNGYIKRWLVDIGDNVRAGQLLAEIETPEVEQQLSQARQTARQSEANLDIARVSAQRWQELLDRKVVSKQDNDEKQSAYQAAAANLAGAKANVAQLEQLEAYNQVTAPFAGRITSRRIDVGALVSAGGGSGTPLYTLARTDPLDIYTRVPQGDAPLIVDGMKAMIAVPEMHGREFEGKVIRNSGALDAQSRTLLTEVEVPNTKGELLAGMYTQVKFELVDKSAPILIPQSAFVFRNTGTQVALIDKDNKIHWQKISVDRDYGTELEVTSGLEENARVVLNPTDDLTEGLVIQKANEVPAEKAAPSAEGGEKSRSGQQPDSTDKSGNAGSSGNADKSNAK